MTEPARRGIVDDPTISDDDVQRMINVIRFLRDPGTPALWVLGGAVLVGFGGLALGWRAAARTLAVPLQTPAVVSGGFGGIALIVTACLVASIHLSRRDAAREDNELERLIDEAYELARVAPALRSRTAPKASAKAAPTRKARPIRKAAPTPKAASARDATTTGPIKVVRTAPKRTASVPRKTSPSKGSPRVGAVVGNDKNPIS